MKLKNCIFVFKIIERKCKATSLKQQPKCDRDSGKIFRVNNDAVSTWSRNVDIGKIEDLRNFVNK